MKKLSIILAGLAIGNMVFAAKVSVSPVKVSYNQITTDNNGKLQQTVIADNGMSVTVGAELEDETLKYSLYLDNITDPNYLLRQDCIKTYYGNFEKDEWTENTSSAYSNVQTKNSSSDSEISAAEACVIAGATCLCALTLFEICNSSSSSSSSTRRVSSSSSNKVSRVPSSPAPVRRSTTTVISPAPVFNWIIIDSGTRASNSNTSPNYNNVTPGMTESVSVGSSYAGTFYVPAGVGPDYRVRFIVSKNEYIDFYFSRSDRDNVANPFKDRNYGRHSLLLSCGIPDFNRFGAYYIYSGKTVGVYTGLSIQSQDWDLQNAAYMENGFNNLTVEDFVPYPKKGNDYNCTYRLNPNSIDDSKTVTDIVDFTLGLTVKTVPHTWLMIGCGLDIGMNHYYGTIEGAADGNDYEVLCEGYVQDNMPLFAAAPQIGVNLIFDHLDFAATYQYSFIDGSKFDLMIGIAF
ncbi:MAG: hypothetical protein KIG96_08565 [Treponema sp.]|nr:hypothetical protein [Treponema sp.]